MLHAKIFHSGSETIKRRTALKEFNSKWWERGKNVSKASIKNFLGRVLDFWALWGSWEEIRKSYGNTKGFWLGTHCDSSVCTKWDLNLSKQAMECMPDVPTKNSPGAGLVKISDRLVPCCLNVSSSWSLSCEYLWRRRLFKSQWKWNQPHDGKIRRERTSTKDGTTPRTRVNSRLRLTLPASSWKTVQSTNQEWGSSRLSFDPQKLWTSIISEDPPLNLPHQN